MKMHAVIMYFFQDGLLFFSFTLKNEADFREGFHAASCVSCFRHSCFPQSFSVPSAVDGQVSKVLLHASNCNYSSICCGVSDRGQVLLYDFVSILNHVINLRKFSFSVIFINKAQLIGRGIVLPHFLHLVGNLPKVLSLF